MLSFQSDFATPSDPAKNAPRFGLIWYLPVNCTGIQWIVLPRLDARNLFYGVLYQKTERGRTVPGKCSGASGLTTELTDDRTTSARKRCCKSCFCRLKTRIVAPSRCDKNKPKYCCFVVYRAPAIGTRSRGIVHRQSLWLACMARRWAAGDGRLATQNGVDV